MTSPDYKKLLEDLLEVAEAACGDPYSPQTIAAKFDLKDTVSAINQQLDHQPSRDSAPNESEVK